MWLCSFDKVSTRPVDQILTAKDNLKVEKGDDLLCKFYHKFVTAWHDWGRLVLEFDISCAAPNNMEIDNIQDRLKHTRCPLITAQRLRNIVNGTGHATNFFGKENKLQKSRGMRKSYERCGFPKFPMIFWNRNLVWKKDSTPYHLTNRSMKFLSTITHIMVDREMSPP